MPNAIEHVYNSLLYPGDLCTTTNDPLQSNNNNNNNNDNNNRKWSIVLNNIRSFPQKKGGKY